MQILLVVIPSKVQILLQLTVFSSNPLLILLQQHILILSTQQAIISQ